MELEQRESSDQKQEAGIATNVTSSSVQSDVYDQLIQKEKDLVLAAELGKALLERNEELTLSNERITEEYSAKLEVRHTRHLTPLLLKELRILKLLAREA